MKRMLRCLAVAGFLLAILVACAEKQSEPATVAAAQNLPPKAAKDDSKLIKSLAETAKTENAKLPMMVDKFTRLDKATTGPGAQISFFYTLPSYSSLDLDRSWIITDVRPKVAAEACADQELKKLLRMGAAVVYIYHGNNGVEINRFQVIQNDCLLIGTK
jgi:hypothetical protein